MVGITGNISRIRDKVAAAACRAGRQLSSVRLVAVSKTKPSALIDEAFAAGQTVFGENYVQELVLKLGEVSAPVEWHFIGHLQSNKVKQIAGAVAMIHSVDRFSLALEIDRQWGKIGQVCDILIQVNISGEETKSGTTSTEAISLVHQVAQLQNLRICGLMTMPPFFDDPDAARPYFRALRLLRDEMRALSIPNVLMEELSMGMSGDFEVAIEEGATLVRVGSAIFGSR